MLTFKDNFHYANRAGAEIDIEHPVDCHCTLSTEDGIESLRPYLYCDGVWQVRLTYGTNRLGSGVIGIEAERIIPVELARVYYVQSKMELPEVPVLKRLIDRRFNNPL